MNRFKLLVLSFLFTGHVLCSQCIVEQISTDISTNNSHAKVDGDIVVWQGNIDGYSRIIMNSNDTTFRISVANVPINDQLPTVSNDTISYLHGRLSVRLYSHERLYRKTLVAEPLRTAGFNNSPQMEGNCVVWSSYNTGVGLNTNHIYWYCNGVLRRISPDSLRLNTRPQTNGEVVVWRAVNKINGQRSIYLYREGNIKRISLSNTDRNSWPQLDGNNIVWYGHDGITNQIFHYNISSEEVRQVSSHPLIDNNLPSIKNGKIAWRAYDGSTTQIYVNTDTGQQKISIGGTTDNSLPKVSSNGRIYWRGNDGVTTQIYSYDGTDQILISDGTSTDNGNHAVSGNTIVWEGHDGTTSQIYKATCSIGSTEPIPTLSSWGLIILLLLLITLSFIHIRAYNTEFYDFN